MHRLPNPTHNKQLKHVFQNTRPKDVVLLDYLYSSTIRTVSSNVVTVQAVFIFIEENSEIWMRFLVRNCF